MSENLFQFQRNLQYSILMIFQHSIPFHNTGKRLKYIDIYTVLMIVISYGIISNRRSHNHIYLERQIFLLIRRVNTQTLCVANVMILAQKVQQCHLNNIYKCTITRRNLWLRVSAAGRRFDLPDFCDLEMLTWYIWLGSPMV